jgi:hypothetical protein
MTTVKYDEKNIRPLTPAGIGIILHIGLHKLIFKKKLLNHEKEFPEILIFDVWRLCSLQRKMRVDAAALCTVTQLQSTLEKLQLSDTDNGVLLMERVTEILLSADYGTRGSNDNSDVFLLPNGESVIDTIRAEIAIIMLRLPPTQAEQITASLLECLDSESDLFMHALHRMGHLVKLTISNGVARGGDIFPVCMAFSSRIKKNMNAVCKIFETIGAIHSVASLRPLIESEVAKLL